MSKLCASFYPFLSSAVAIAMALCLSLILGQQLRILRKHSPGFDRQSGRILLVMLAFALLEISLLFFYVLSPKAGC